MSVPRLCSAVLWCLFEGRVSVPVRAERVCLAVCVWGVGFASVSVYFSRFFCRLRWRVCLSVCGVIEVLAWGGE